MNPTHVIVIATTLLLPLLVCLVNSLCNRRRQSRWRQAFTPLWALAYVILCCLLFAKVREWTQALLSLPALADLYRWIQTGSGLTYGAELYIALAVNLLVSMGFVIVKLLLRGLAALIDRRQEPEDQHAAWEEWENAAGRRKVFDHFANLFYSMEDGSRTLRDSWVGALQTLRCTAYIVTALYLLLLVFLQVPLLNSYTWFPYDTAQRFVDSLYLWPAISLTLIWEGLFFLDGNEENHLPEESLIVTEGERRHHADYSELVGEFRNQFPERYVDTLQAPTFPRLRRDVTPQTAVARAILARLRERSQRQPISPDIMDCVASLPDRQNAVIDAALSSEFGECLMLYVNVLLSRGENLLVLCENEDECERTRDYIREELTRINVFGTVWIVQSVREAYMSGDCDVLLLTPQAALDDRIGVAKHRFFSNLTTVLTVDTSRIIAEMGGLMTVVSCALGRGRELQYICLCNGIPTELRGTLSQILSPGVDFRPFECFRSDERNQIMLWNYEASGDTKPMAQNNLFSTAMNHVYLGVTLPLACVAAKYDVQGISVMAAHIPARQLRDAMLADFSKMNQYFNSRLRAEEFVDRLRFNRIDSQNPFIVVLDDTCNLPMTMRNYCRYIGQETAMVHVVSKPYMLRDYFASAADEYLRDRKKSETVAPVLLDTEKITVIKLISEAAGGEGLTEEKLMRRMRAMGRTVDSLRDALQQCYTLALNGEAPQDIENVFQVSTRCDYDPEKRDFISHRMVSLKDPTLLERLTGDIHPARVQANDQEFMLGIGRQDAFRYYLPNQAIVVRNYMYYIDEIDLREGVIYAGRMLEKLDLPVDYVQHRQYHVDLMHNRAQYPVKISLKNVNDEDMCASRYEAQLLRGVKLRVDTLGYFAPYPSTASLDLTDLSSYRELEDAIRQQARREMSNASAISLSFHGLDASRSARVALTLAVLLGETMKTLFPYTCPCLAVCPVIPKDAEPLPDDELTRNLCMAYPQVRCENDDTPATTARVLIIEDSESDTGMLDALYRNRQTPLSSVFSMLLRFLKWQQEFTPQGNIRGDYLYFGGDTVPRALDLDGVRAILRQMEQTSPTETIQPDEPPLAEVCYFCHKSLHNCEHVVLYGDNGKKDRMVCMDCSKRLLNKRSQLMPLYQRAREYLEGTCGVKLPKHLNVRFASASTMTKRMNRNLRKMRIIGLAESLTKTVWVERDCPEEYILRILVHELTHFWQFDNLVWKKDVTPMEGHASYMEVQYLRYLGFDALADETHAGLMGRDDPYGRGYRMLRKAMENRLDDDIFAYMLETYGKPSVKKAREKEKAQKQADPPAEE